MHFLTDRAGTGDPPQTNYPHRVFYVGTDVRTLLESSRVEYLPLSLADVPRLFANGQLPLDVAMVQETIETVVETDLRMQLNEGSTASS